MASQLSMSHLSPLQLYPIIFPTHLNCITFNFSYSTAAQHLFGYVLVFLSFFFKFDNKRIIIIQKYKY